MPWKRIADSSGFINLLLGFSALLGPIAGILIADYFIVRKMKLNLAALYQTEGEYRYTSGFSIAGLTALTLAVLPNLPGFLVKIGALSATSVHPFFVHWYDYAWFIGFAIAFVAYLVLRQFSPTSSPAR